MLTTESILKSRTHLAIIIFLSTLLACSDSTQDLKQDRISVLLDSYDNASQPVKALGLLDSVVLLLPELRNDSLKCSYYFELSDRYYAHDIEKYALAVRKALDLAEKKNNEPILAKSFYYLGDYHEDVARADSALYYYRKASVIYRHIGDTLNTGRMELYKAGILYDMGLPADSEVLAVKALPMINAAQNIRLSYECHNLIALSLKEQQQYSKSLTYFSKTLSLLKLLEESGYPAHKVLISQASCYNNIGLLYEKIGDLKKAEEYFRKGITVPHLSNTAPLAYAALCNNLGGILTDQDRITAAAPLLYESLALRKQYNNPSGIAASKIRIGQFLIRKGDTIQALEEFRQGLSTARLAQSHYDILNALELLVKNDRRAREYYSDQYFRINDSLALIEKQTRDKFARIAYETSQAESRSKEMRSRLIYISFFSAVTLAALLLLVIILRLRLKNRLLRHSAEQQEKDRRILMLIMEQEKQLIHSRDDERKRIARDLHDTIINRVFTTRFNLSLLSTTVEGKKQSLIAEMEGIEEAVRKVSHDLMERESFSKVGFPVMLRELIHSQSGVANIRFEIFLDQYIDWDVIDIQKKVHLYSILQEGIQNVIKHSGAELCDITVIATGDILRVEIWDNGTGFELPKGRPVGIGLKNMRQRADEIQAKFIIQSLKGTRIILEIPLA